MGYELYLHIGKKITWDKKEIGIIETAKFDLCKIGYNSHLSALLDKERKKIKDVNPELTFEKGEEPAEIAYLWDSSGDKKILKDRYGDFLFHVDPKKVLKAIQKDHKEQPYRVYRLVASYLRGAITAYKGQNLTCVFFGH